MEHSLRLIELGGVVLGLALLSRLAVRFGFSPIPLYLLGGLAFGSGGILPLVTSEEFIEVGASIGVVLLLLTLGLEYSTEELLSTLRMSGTSGVMNVAFNFTPGFLAGLFLGWSPVAAAFLGGITYVSSSGIASKLLEDFRWVGNRETPVVLSLLVMEDLTMAVYLPLIGVLVAAGGVVATLVSITTALITVAIVLFVAVRHGALISRALVTHSNESLLLSILGLTLLIAGVLELARVSAAVGAFFVGLALSGPLAERARPLLEPLRDLFAAVFFVFFSLEINPASIPPVIWPAIELAVMTAATKAAAVRLAARRAGVATRGQWRAAILLIPRGEFSIAIAAIAVAAGVEPQLGPLAAAYVLMLAIAGPTAALVFRNRLARRSATIA
ncbi:MAG TPA: cation:proton antiporter [Actinomycetota bacterium]|nr:cation:proton antiporter [Actinomycetota bacterium]